MRPALILVAVLLSGCYGVQVAPPPAGPLAAPPDAAADWAAVLDRFVDDRGRTDFVALAGERRRLDRYVGYIAVVSPESRPDLFPDRDHELAYYINAYNSLAMANVLEQDLPYSVGGLGLVEFFVLPHYRVGGQSISLFNLERAVIIDGYRDERAHFALNCMVRDCPRLPRVPFSGTGLDGALDAATREFVADPGNVQVDHRGRVVTLNEIFGFYEDEFLAVAPSLLAYVNRYRTVPVPEDYAVDFRAYDWRVNYQPGTTPARPVRQRAR